MKDTIELFSNIYSYIGITNFKDLKTNDVIGPVRYGAKLYYLGVYIPTSSPDTYLFNILTDMANNKFNSMIGFIEVSPHKTSFEMYKNIVKISITNTQAVKG